MLTEKGHQGGENRAGSTIGMPGVDGLQQGPVALPQAEVVADPHPEPEVVILFVGRRLEQGFECLHRQSLEAELDRLRQGLGIVFVSGHKVRVPKADRSARASPRYLQHYPPAIYERPPYLP